MAERPDEIRIDDRSTGRRETEAASAEETARPETTEEFRADIAKTRAEMAETVEALQERLSPSHLMTQATGSVKEATVGRLKTIAQQASNTAGALVSPTSDTAARFAQWLRENPIPLAVIGVAAAWLVMNVRRRRTQDDWRWSGELRYPTPSAREGGAGFASSSPVVE